MFPASYLVLGGILAVVMFLTSAFKITREYERAVVFRLGRLIKTRGPGLVIIIPVIEKMVRVSLRLVVMDVPPQDIITKDNVSVKVNAVVYFRVMEPAKAIVDVEDFYYATSQLAQTTLRSILGQVELDDLLSEREKINHDLQEILDASTDPWGVKVANVEIKHVDLPQEMQRAMAKQAEAERERRAKIIAAEGEHQAAEKLAMAADILSTNPQAIQLRYLQTLREIATENNSTTLFPIPMDLLTGFMKLVDKAGGDKDK
ncbi:MAG: slipin family protein [bacterium]|nr:slipin family protein [bacterium]MDT8366884.1 slipin family protein [bacterium]